MLFHSLERQAGEEAREHAVTDIEPQAVARRPQDLDPAAPLGRPQEGPGEGARPGAQDRHRRPLQKLREADDRERQRHASLEDRQLHLPGAENHGSQQQQTQV